MIRRQRRPFFIGLVIGGVILGNGVRGLLVNSRATHPFDFALWFFGSLVAHDAILAPIVFVLGALLARKLPQRIRRVVLPAAIISGVVTLFALPYLLGYGGKPDNPTLLTRNYPAGFAIVIVAIWIPAAVVGLLRRGSSAEQSGSPPPSR